MFFEEFNKVTRIINSYPEIVDELHFHRGSEFLHEGYRHSACSDIEKRLVIYDLNPGFIIKFHESDVLHILRDMAPRVRYDVTMMEIIHKSDVIAFEHNADNVVMGTNAVMGTNNEPKDLYKRVISMFDSCHVKILAGERLRLTEKGIFMLSQPVSTYDSTHNILFTEKWVDTKTGALKSLSKLGFKLFYSAPLAQW